MDGEHLGVDSDLSQHTATRHDSLFPSPMVLAHSHTTTIVSLDGRFYYFYISTFFSICGGRGGEGLGGDRESWPVRDGVGGWRSIRRSMFFFWFKFSFSEIYIGYFLFIYFLFCRSGGVLIFCGFARRWTGGGKWELFLSYIRGFFF